MDFSYIMRTSSLKKDPLYAFGFEDVSGRLVLKKSLEPDFPNFYVKVSIDGENIAAEVFEKSALFKDRVNAGVKVCRPDCMENKPDCTKTASDCMDDSADEKYALLDVPRANGGFVGKLREKVSDVMEEIKNACFETLDVKEKYVAFIEERFGARPDFPWEDLPDYAVFRCGNKKWFSLVMKIRLKKLGIESDEYVWVANLKASQEKIQGLVDGKTVFSAYHMNKKHWITVLLESAADFEKILRLTEESYSLVENSAKK